jgi:formaldehyde-activating enzyme involved in methanogenesis
VRGANKVAVIAAVSDELENVVASQPIHAADQAQAKAAAESFIGVLPDDDTKDIAVSVNGWVTTSDGIVQGASVSVSASLQSKAVAT